MGYFKSIRNRIGDIIPFDQSRITNAILKALEVANEGGIKDAERVSDDVLKALKKKYPMNHVLGIEDIQDIVEQQLILADYAKAAKGYILYRQERARLREERREIPERVKKLAEKSKNILKIRWANLFITVLIPAGWIRKTAARLGLKQSADIWIL